MRKKRTPQPKRNTGQDDWASWFSGKEFSSDWASPNFPIWDACLADMRASGQSISILEIGTWEGRAAIFFLEYFQRSTITCVDTFDGGLDHYGRFIPALPKIEQRFDANLSSYSGRVRKLKTTSTKALAHLAEEGARFDLIYIDGGHDRDTVHVDSLLAWPLLKDGGIAIWDDYDWGKGPNNMRPIDQRPEEAINLFVASRRDGIEILHREYQLVARKVSSSSPKQKSIVTEMALRSLRIKRLTVA